jgi:pimeloyl-ACP methyl ester carboxylesterase
MHIVYADGIGSSVKGFTDGQSILYKVVERLIELNPSITSTRVTWPASMAMVGGNKSWEESSSIGVADVNTIVDANPQEKFILLGYSGGNRVIHEWLEQNPNKLDKIAAVGLMSDPYRPRDKKQAELSDTTGWGICGEKLGPIPDRTFWTVAQADVISDALVDSILRTPADASSVMPGQFLVELRNHMKTGDLQLAWQLGVFKQNPLAWFTNLGIRLYQARIDIKGYMGGLHTTAYITPYAGGPSLAARLANSIDRYVKQH